MEEFTNIGMYPKPFDTSLVKNIIAEKDAYIVRSSEPTMQDIWPGSCVEVIFWFSYYYRCFIYRI